MALTDDEQRFLDFWEANRHNRAKLQRKYSIGLPLGLIIMMVFINIFSGWNKRADVILRSYPSYIPVILIAVAGIAFFVAYFARKHRWDQNEQRYQELKQKKVADATNE